MLKLPGRNRTRVSATITLGLLALSSGVPRAADLDSLRITFAALDHGEATLVQMPGDKALLLGAGTREEGPRLVRWLKAQGIRRLEGVFVQTWKDAHIGGIPAVLRAFPVGQVLVNPSRAATAGTTLLDRVGGELQRENRLLMGSPVPGDRQTLNFNPLCQITVVGPTGAMQNQFRSDPNNSMVLEFREDNIAFLSLGDAGQVQQAALWKELETKPWGQVLRVGQEGGAKSVLIPTIKALKTRVAVIPVAKRSGRKPDAGLINALSRSGARVYRTDLQGTITVTVNDRSTQVKTGGARP